MNQGYFLLKGLRQVRAEFSLSALAYNLLRVMNIVAVKGGWWKPAGGSLVPFVGLSNAAGRPRTGFTPSPSLWLLSTKKTASPSTCRPERGETVAFSHGLRPF